jgi:uncharacterized protein (DUF433 family)
MSLSTTTVPLFTDEADVMRVNDTRVSLDSVIFAFNDGATPEEIVQQYPTLNLSDVYAVISYYLQNRAEVEDYLERRHAERLEQKKEIEARFNPRGLRERLLARQRSHRD